MAYQVKKALTSIAASIIVLFAYVLYALNKVRITAAGPEDWKVWAGIILVFIGIGVGLTIVIQIVFRIVMAVSIAVQKRECDGKEVEKTLGASLMEDEIDKLIELKSLRVCLAFIGAGFVAGLAALVLGLPPAAMLNILFFSWQLGSLAVGLVSLHYYKAGV